MGLLTKTTEALRTAHEMLVEEKRNTRRPPVFEEKLAVIGTALAEAEDVLRGAAQRGHERKMEEAEEAAKRG